MTKKYENYQFSGTVVQRIISKNRRTYIAKLRFFFEIIHKSNINLHYGINIYLLLNYIFFIQKIKPFYQAFNLNDFQFSDTNVQRTVSINRSLIICLCQFLFFQIFSIFFPIFPIFDFVFQEYLYHLSKIDDHGRLIRCLCEWEMLDKLYSEEYSTKLLHYWRLVGTPEGGSLQATGHRGGEGYR